MMYLLHSIQDSEDQRGDKKENNMVRFRVPTSSEITRKKERATERERASKSELKSEQKQAKASYCKIKASSQLTCWFSVKRRRCTVVKYVKVRCISAESNRGREHTIKSE